MYRRVVVAAIFAAALSTSAAHAETLAACEQSIEYKVQAPGAQVPANLQGFSGVWTGKWDSGLCSALVVEGIEPDGTARLLYVNGSMGGQYPVKAGNRRFSGKIAGNKLTAAGSLVTIEYTLRSPGELSATYTSQYGSFRGSFRKQ